MKKILPILSLVFLSVALVPESFAAFITHPVPVADSATAPTSASVSSALHEFMNLSRKERRLRLKDAKAEIKSARAAKKSGDEPSTNQLLLVILAILLPPLAVYLHEGEINGKFWLDLILTLLFFIPGVVYALIVVLKKD